MGMSALTKAGGSAQAFPDACNTPTPGGAVPIPYPNLAQLNTADNVCDKVLIQSKETIVECSKVPNSSGDEAGSSGGVVSGEHRGEVQFKQYSSKVIADGKKMVFLSAVSAHNGSNANSVGQVVAPSQSKVLIRPT